MIDTISVEGLKDAIQSALERRPTRCVIASNIWTRLRTSVEFKTTTDLRNTFSGLPMEMSHGLADNEWFTLNRAGNVLEFNGDEVRIRMIARAYRTSRFNQ